MAIIPHVLSLPISLIAVDVFMTNSPIPPNAELLSVVAEKIPEVVTEADEALFDAITPTRLTGASHRNVIQEYEARLGQ